MKDPTELVFLDETEGWGVSRTVSRGVAPQHQDAFTRLAPDICYPADPSEEQIRQINIVATLIQVSRRQTFAADLETLFALLRGFLGNDAVEHDLRVGVMVTEMIVMLGVSREHARVFGLAAALHDIGKLGVSDAILHKPAPLSDDEMALVRGHPLLGASILEQSALHFFVVARLIAKYHHERWDGSGYPTGLRREAIPVLARITSLCDVYDCLLHPRPYKDAWSQERVIRTLKAGAGREFDPALVEILLTLLGRDQGEMAKVYN